MITEITRLKQLTKVMVVSTLILWKSAANIFQPKVSMCEFQMENKKLSALKMHFQESSYALFEHSI